MKPFVQKYLPKKIEDIKGNEKAVNSVLDYITNYKKQKKKAAFLYGPTGTGKTSSIYAIANKLELEVQEVNASDVRNKEQINQRLSITIQQQSLFSKGKIILIDEIDGLSGRKDRGGIQALIKLMDLSKYPIVFTATNPWDTKFSGLRKKTEMISFAPLNYLDIFKVLKNITIKEKIKANDDTLKSLSRRAAGDTRAAINDLQMLTNNKELTKESLDELSDREKQENMINALTKIFKTTDPKIAIKAFEYVKEDVNDQMLWLDKNIPEEYTNPQDLARAYDKLSKADVFNRRIRRWQHWRFLVYINALITAGIATSKDQKYKKFVEYKPTGRILKMWWAKQKSMKKKAIAAKIATKTHTSTKRALKDFDMFKLMFRNNKTLATNLTNYLDLDKEEVTWLKK